MTIYARLFEDKDFNQINKLLELYYELGYPATSKELIHRLKKIYNHEDYYILLLIKDEVIIGFTGMCRIDRKSVV